MHLVGSRYTDILRFTVNNTLNSDQCMHEMTSKQYTSVNIQCLCRQSGGDKMNTSQARNGKMETTGRKKCIYKNNNKI
jgi:hypothetical protein